MKVKIAMETMVKSGGLHPSFEDCRFKKVTLFAIGKRVSYISYLRHDRPGDSSRPNEEGKWNSRFRDCTSSEVVRDLHLLETSWNCEISASLKSQRSRVGSRGTMSQVAAARQVDAAGQKYESPKIAQL